MNFRIVKTLYKKEILDVLRDKKTVIMMLIVPLILYPLMLIVGMQLMTSISTSMAEHNYIIAFDFEDEGGVLKSMFEGAQEEGYSLTVVEISDLDNALINEEIDVFIRKEIVEGKETFIVTYLSAVTNSSYATDLVIDVLKDYSLQLTVDIIEEANLDVNQVLYPIDIAIEDRSSNEESAGSLMGTIVPFMLVVSLLMGTMYPAIDTTAGERERGTLETVLTLPVTNQEIFFSKFLAVATIGIVSAILNLVSMGGIGVYMFKLMQGMGMDGGVNMSQFVPAIIIGVMCVLAFAIFISAISMCVCVFAKSYKEANNYITPLTLVVMFASMISMIPNVSLSSNIALMPVANVCLLIRDLLAFKFEFGAISIVLISNILYGMLSVMFLGKIYNSEAILFSDGSTSVQIFERRSNMKKGGVPAFGDMWLVLAVTLLMMIYVGGLVQVDNMKLGVIATQLIVLLIPLLASIYTKKDLKKTFKLKLPKVKFVFGGVLIIIGAMLVGMILTGIAGTIFKNSATEMTESMNYIMGDNFLLALLLVALLPAICEEMMFRGFVFSTFSNKLSFGKAAIISGVIFGAYHMNLTQFFATSLLGIAICYVAYKSESLLPGIIMHFTNNMIATATIFYPDIVKKIAPVLMKESLYISDIIFILALGIIFVCLGLLVLNIGAKKVQKN